MWVTGLVHVCDMTRSICRATPIDAWRDVTHSYSCHDSCVCVSWLVHTRGMTYSCVWCGASEVSEVAVCSLGDSSWMPRERALVFLVCEGCGSCGFEREGIGRCRVHSCYHSCVMQRIHMCHATHSYVWSYASICVMWRIHMCDVTHSYMWCDAFICVTLRIHMCHATHSYVWCYAFIYVMSRWRIHMCHVTHPYVSCDAFICVMLRSHMCHVTHPYVSCDAFICVMLRSHICHMTHVGYQKRRWVL